MTYYPPYTIAQILSNLTQAYTIGAHTGSRSNRLQALHRINELVKQLTGCLPESGDEPNRAALRALIGEYSTLLVAEIIERLEAEAIRRRLLAASSPVAETLEAMETRLASARTDGTANIPRRKPGKPKTPKTHVTRMRELRKANPRKWTYAKIADTVSKEFDTKYSEDAVRDHLKPRAQKRG